MEIVAAFDRWQTDLRAAEAIAGFTAAAEEMDRALQRCNDLMRHLIAHRALTPEDLLVKAEIACWIFGDRESLVEHAARCERDKRRDDYAVLISLARDAVLISGQTGLQNSPAVTPNVTP
ncbi:MAG: hypothetical protein KF735_08610 [Chelatococcus sp.]|uniref:hypothetical protein n=1 Tax=Chelatococcus sp. TaxID=1953771 RepID=UPI0025B91D82|nr:hypothetical protein [Chelatococcus sp.]MBX3537685.1 hypothetical protein [Chelatococcus sp.]